MIIYIVKNKEYDLATTVFSLLIFNIFVDNKIKLSNPDPLLAAIDAQFANFVERVGFNNI